MGRYIDPAKAIARLALRDDNRFEGVILEEVLNFCWDQLGYIRSDAEMQAIRDALHLSADDEEQAAAEEADDRRRDNPLAPHFRRLGV